MRFISGCFVWCVLAAGLLASLPPSFWFLEILTSCGLWMAGAVALVAVLLVANLPRWRWIWRVVGLLVCMALGVGYAKALVPFYLEEQMPAAVGAARLRVVFANVRQDNIQQSLIAKRILEQNPDVIALAEVDAGWVRGLGFSENYPHAIELPQNDRFGLALYSRRPILRSASPIIGERLPPVLRATVAAGEGREVTFFVVHAPPPLSAQALSTMMLLTRRLSTLIRHLPGDTVLLGDLNAAPFSHIYGRFARGAYLTNVFAGRGLHSTWHPDERLPGLALDHILYKGTLTSEGAVTFPLPGSDHRGIVVDILAVQSRQSQ